MVDDAREITPEQAASYVSTGKKARTLIPEKVVGAQTAKGPGAKSVAMPVPEVEDAVTPTTRRVYVRLSDTGDQSLLLSLKAAIDGHRGNTDVVLVLGPAKQAIKLPAGINEDAGAIAKLENLVGAENVKVQ